MKGIIAAVLVLSLSSVCWSEEKTNLKDQKARDSYSLGYEFGGNLKRQEIELDREVLLRAVQDALDNKNPGLSREEIRDTILKLRQKTMVMQDRRFRERAAKNLAEGKAFRAKNETKEGVKVLPSGLQYKIISEGTGTSPNETDAVTVNYRGTFIDGSEFDSSYGRSEPATMNMIGVIPGWKEALPLMKTGSKWQIFLPPELGYGARQYGRIPANSALIFELELIAVKKGITAGDPVISHPTEISARESNNQKAD